MLHDHVPSPYGPNDVGTCGLRIALIVPCYNEAKAIGNVVDDFIETVPGIICHVFDNNSTDNTADVARAHGATVHHVRHKGKGNVVRRMFADIEADIYIMVDGDATYDAKAAPKLIQTLIDGNLDMVVGSRVSNEVEAYRPGHRWGNRMLTGFVSMIFGRAFDDMLSGYRVFSRRFVKSFPAHARGFETETELAVHALELRMPVTEIPTVYGARGEGSVSKLNTYRDGWRILVTILRLFKAERPFAFFTIGFALLQVLSMALAMPLVWTYLETGLVPRIPTALLCSGITILGFLLLVCGMVLETVTLGRIEAKRLVYIQTPSTYAVVKE